MPVISIIVPIYNVEKYIHRCIDSILNQTFTDFELILVDDGSPDNCGAICDEYAKKDKRIKVIHKENGGLSSARNAGIDAAQGEYLGFVDSDDWIHPQMYEILYKGIIENNVKISVCEYEETSIKKDFEIINYLDFEIYNGLDFLVSNNIVAVIAPNKLYNKNLFKGIRYPIGKIHEDEFTTYKLLYEAGDIAYIKEKLYKYFINRYGITKLESTLNKEGNDKKLQEKRDYFLKKGINELEAFKGTIDFFKNRNEKMYLYSCWRFRKSFIHYYKKIYSVSVFSSKDNEIIKIMCSRYKDIRVVSNKYEKLYYFMIRYNILRKWIAKNDFEPIQNVLRKIKKFG